MKHVQRWMRSIEPFLGPLIEVARGFDDLTGVPVDLASALFLRAELAGFDPPGRTSAGGSCHLLETADGWVAVNLARSDDLAAVPALIAMLSPPATTLADAVRGVSAAEVTARAQLLGVAAAAL